VSRVLLVVVALSAVSVPCAAVWLSYCRTFVQEAGEWVIAPCADSVGGFAFVTLPEEGNTPYLVVCYMGGVRSGNAYGGLQIHSQAWDDVVFHSLSLLSEPADVNEFSFPTAETAWTDCFPVGRTFMVGVLLRPEEGYSWADIPRTYSKLLIGGGECNTSGGTSASLFTQIELIGSRAQAWVDAIAGSDTLGDGTPGNPFRSIQSGVCSVRDGMVFIRPGTYSSNTVGSTAYGVTTVSSGRKVQLIGIDWPVVTFGIICSASSADSGRVALVQGVKFSLSSSYYPKVRFSSHGAASFEISDCRFSNPQDGIIAYGSGSSSTGRLELRRCTFANSRMEDIFVKAHRGHVLLENCLVSDLTSPSHPLFQANDGGTITIVNCTIARTTSTPAPFLTSQSSIIEIFNSIVYSNTPTTIGGTCEVISEYTCNDMSWVGLGNIADDPAFTDSEGGDFHLLNSSSCIDAASSIYSPITDLDGILRDANPDMGAYEASGNSIPGDVSGDGVVDVIDVQIAYSIVMTGSGPTAYQLTHGDMDLDGDLDLDDITILAEYVIGRREGLP